MKIFQTVRRQYAIVGICRPSNQSTQECPFNNRILFGFLLFGCLILLQFVYILHVANGFMEFMVSACSTSASITMFVCFAAVVYRKSTLFECFDNMKKLINSSMIFVLNSCLIHVNRNPNINSKNLIKSM